MPVPIPFAKMNGIGNAILVVDLRAAGRSLAEADAARIGREPGFGFDQLMAISPPQHPGTDAFIDIFNIDGTRAGACGNGTRCVAWAMLRDSAGTHLTLQTRGFDLACEKIDATTFSVDMGAPRLGWQDIPLAGPVPDTANVALPRTDGRIPPALSHFSAVSVGNPHAVFFVDDVAAVDLAGTGSAIETHPLFPDRANVSFAQIVSPAEVLLRTWERGAGATLACGSAACATVVAGIRAGRLDRTVRVSQRGGDLSITWRPTDRHVVMTGGVVLEREGRLPTHLLDPGA